MVILLVSDCQTRATRVRHILAQSGFECPLTNVVPVDAAVNAAAMMQPNPALIVFVALSHDGDRAQTVLRQLRDASDTLVLAIGPRDPNLILGMLHAGANDYLDESGDLQGELRSALSRMFASASKRSSSGRLALVIGAGGGCGRTFFATNLAAALAKSHKRCGLFDLDPIGADVATYLNLKPRHNIADLCVNIDKLDQQMFEQSLLDHPSGVSVLAAPETWDEARHVSGEGLKKVIRFGKAMFPTIVADLHSLWLSEFVHPLQDASAILLLFRLDFASIRNVYRVLSTIERAGVDRERVQLVASRYGRPKEISTAQAETALEMKIRHFLPEDAQAVNTCINCGAPAVIEAPRCAVAKAILGIAKSLSVQFADAAEDIARSVDAKTANPVAEKVRAFFEMSRKAVAPHA